MRILPLLLLVACSKDPLKQDVELMCHANMKQPLDVLGPALQTEAKSDEFQGVLAKLKAGQWTVLELGAWLEDAAKRTGVDPCPNVAVLRAK